MNTLLGFIYTLAALTAYWTPTIVAWIRHVPNKGSVTVINTLLGLTFIGWIIALAMACRSRPLPTYTYNPDQALPAPTTQARRSREVT